jgi:hypothetical protein
VSALDEWLPAYDHREHHERAVAAPPEAALEAALGVPVESDWIARTLFRLRGMNGRGKSLEQLFAPPWANVLERTPTAFVAKLAMERIHVVFDLRARAAAGGSVLSTETRVAGGGLAFRAYWLVVRPFSGLIRRRWLIAAAKRAAAPSPNAR